MTDPFEDDDGSDSIPQDTERVSMDVDKLDAIFVEQWALYRNAIYLLRKGKRRRRLLTRKSQAERMFKQQVDTLREQLRQMHEAVGPFPELTGDKDKDAKASEAYAKKVLAWNDKLEAAESRRK